MSERPALRLEIYGVDLPDPADYPNPFLGLVEGREVTQRISLAQAHAQGEVFFSTRVELALNPQTQTARFYGPAVQGSGSEPFIYLIWQRADPTGWLRERRIKLPLTLFTFPALERALAEDRPLRLRARLVNARGEPAAASLRGENLQVLD